MLFFQTGLLGGYTYAHLIGSRLRAREQGILHASLIAGCLALMAGLTVAWGSPITPGATWKPVGDRPIRDILLLLTVSAGLPYFILSSTGPLLQAWFGRVHSGRSPYRLYALSNLGSFLALVSFPFLLEPALSLKTQARLWWWAFLCFAVACAYCAVCVAGAGAREVSEPAPNEARDGDIFLRMRPRAGSYALWTSLAACAAVMFLATTNQICQDIGVVPLLWVLPLSLYLLSFIVCFEKEGWYSRRWFHPLLGVAIFAGCFLVYGGARARISLQATLYAFVLFVCCMVCHGEIAKSKPHPRYLTSFYLSVAAGGALGGVFVTLVAPHIFKGFWEYNIGVWLCAVLALLVVVRDRESWIYRYRWSPVGLVAVACLLPEAALLATPQKTKGVAYLPLLLPLVLVLYALLSRKRQDNKTARYQATPIFAGMACLLMGATLLGGSIAHARKAVALSRNFYGVLGVSLDDPENPERAAYVLKHGHVIHGFQFRADDKRRLATTYYTPASGIGLALAQNPSRTGTDGRRGLRIGAVGLGTGTIATYGEAGDTFRFYEINPQVIRIASDGTYFSYLRDSRAQVEVVPGDARLSMERELARGEPQNFDVLAIDAFSGDSIPVHLLTKEAFQIYLKHLRGPEAIIAVHISNLHLDLRPVVLKLAEQFGLANAMVDTEADGEAVSASDWVLLSKANSLVTSGHVGMPLVSEDLPNTRQWTDDYSNLLQVLRR